MVGPVRRMLGLIENSHFQIPGAALTPRQAEVLAAVVVAFIIQRLQPRLGRA